MHAHARSGAVGPEELPALALSRPRAALAQARALAAEIGDPLALSYAHQAAGIVHRENGAMEAAVAALRLGLRKAKASGRPERVADVRATLGATLVMDGQARRGMAHLDQAAESASGTVLATVLMRRAYILGQLGRHDDALADMARALRGIRKAGDRVWEGRALTNRGAIHLARGSLARAEQDIVRAEALLLAAGQELEAVDAFECRGLIAFRRGDLPRTLSLYDEAARRYAPIAPPPPDLAIDRCAALMAAGLADDALEVVEQALAEPEIQPRSRAELLLSAANAALSAGDPAKALSAGRQARRLFRSQGREWWEARAELAVIRARRDGGEHGRPLLTAGTAVAHLLQKLRIEEAPHALLLAGRLAAERGDPSAHDLLSAAARYRHHASALVRATGWLAQAMDRRIAGGTRGVFSACARGLDAIDDHRTTLGSSELRALATRHGQELAGLALRMAVSGDSRRLLTWSERCRATALTQPPVRPPRDGAAAAAAALDTMRGQPDRRQGPPPRGSDVDALEQAIRSQRHRLPGVAAGPHRFDIRAFLDELAEETFVELLEVDGDLHAIVVSRRRVRSQLVGPIAAALAEVSKTRFMLRQAARGRPTSLAGAGESLQSALLGSAAAMLGPGPVIIAPSSRLHATPWSLLPALADRPVSVVPSAVMWQRARSTPVPAAARMVLVAGPGLQTGGAEVRVLAGSNPSALLLRGRAATVSACLGAVDGASLVHIAAHGLFRPDSPMFSSLLLDDGPLTVHDFELLSVAPYRLVLSACESGVMVPVGSNELLGLAAALLSMGTAGVLSSIAEVNDEATVELMLDVHRGLATGAGLAEVLLNARERARGELVAEATAAAFVALGV